MITTPNHFYYGRINVRMRCVNWQV